MKTKELKEKYDNFIRSLTYEETDLFDHLFPDVGYCMMLLKSEVD